MRAVIDRKIPPKNTFTSRDDQNMKKNFPHCKMIRGILYRQISAKRTQSTQLVLPKIIQAYFIRAIHDIGHPVRDRTYLY